MWATRIVRTRSAFAAMRSIAAAPINGSYCSKRTEGRSLYGGTQHGHRRVILTVLECGNRSHRGLQIPQTCNGTAKLIGAPSGSLLPLFPIGNKSESARKLLRLEVGRELELDERLFTLLIRRVMEPLETY